MCCDDARREKTFHIGINIGYERTIHQKPKYCRETADRRATIGSNFFSIESKLIAAEKQHIQSVRSSLDSILLELVWHS